MQSWLLSNQQTLVSKRSRNHSRTQRTASRPRTKAGPCIMSGMRKNNASGQRRQTTVPHKQTEFTDANLVRATIRFAISVHRLLTPCFIFRSGRTPQTPTDHLVSPMQTGFKVGNVDKPHSIETFWFLTKAYGVALPRKRPVGTSTILVIPKRLLIASTGSLQTV